MAGLALIKPTHKAIKHYYAALQSYRDDHVEHEGALETAFQRLLDETARPHGWKLIPKQKLKVGKHTIFPDGTLRDLFNMRCGFWEAKDTNDDLDAEIQKKIAKGYPLSNIIFEDTRHAVLFQGGRERCRFDLAKPKELAALLNEFYTYTEPEIDSFHQAVEEFKSQVPELAGRLLQILAEAHKSNRKFQAAFDAFFKVCQDTLNPNISQAAVDEMLVQHLLTERLIRKIFDNPEFTRRNVIAAEVEKVIDALVSLSFNRDSFLRSLDRFYRAIEEAAHGLEDFSEKQHFLNTIYERFFQGYSVKVADTHGIVYTPQEIVDFMCSSVGEILANDFGLSLSSPRVYLLDPCTGTGNFIVNLLTRMPNRDLPRMCREQLFANEVMLMPYYIAALNIEHAYYERVGTYEAFDGLCFVDTLELAEAKGNLAFMGEKNAERVEREKRAPITVIIGNPPYNANQVNENDNNKNRRYPIIDRRIKDTYARDSTATLKNKLYDPYVKFFRWAVDRLGNSDGVVCFVTNNNFVVDQAPFDGMRKHLADEFTSIYHVDLHGNVRQNPKLSGTTHNVFGIQVGVGITVAVRHGTGRECTIRYHRVPESWRKEQKLAWLAKTQSISGVAWDDITPDSDCNWVVLPTSDAFRGLMPIGDESGDGVLKIFSTGAKSNRDEVVYGFDQGALAERVQRFADEYNAEVDRYKRKGASQGIDQFVDCTAVKWSSTLKAHLVRGRYAEVTPEKFRVCLYRPFTKMHLFYDAILNDRPGLFRYVFPTPQAEADNVAICCTNHSQMPFVVQITNHIANEAVGGRAGTCFPFFVYDKRTGERRENVTDWALQRFREHYGDETIGKRDVFYYLYGILHHPGYRERFADNLKRELPRIPMAPDFGGFAVAGGELARLHLDYEKLDPFPLEFIETPGLPLSYRVEDKMRLSKDKTALAVNPTLTLAGIPPETFAYRLGNRSALEWVIDQYQVSEDLRSGIGSDPNRDEDPEYIVRLVGQVVRVSLETVRIVASLPTEYGA
jgi:predicted helicase